MVAGDEAVCSESCQCEKQQANEQHFENIENLVYDVAESVEGFGHVALHFSLKETKNPKTSSLN